MRDLKKDCSITCCILAILMAILSAVAINAFADDILPYTFTPGSTISSAQVNQNFQALSNVTPRIKNAVGGNFTLGSSYQNLATLTITPKDSGTVMLFGSAGVTLAQGEQAGGSNWGTSTAIICITQTSGGGHGTPDTNCSSVWLDTPYISNLGVQNWAPRTTVPVTIIGSAPVIKDTTITFYLTAAKDSWSVGSSTINGSGLNAIFFHPGL